MPTGLQHLFLALPQKNFVRSTVREGLMCLLKCFVQSTVIEGLMGFGNQCCVYYWLSQIFNQGAQERALLPAYPTSSTACLFTSTQEWAMRTSGMWLKLDQVLSLQVSAHASSARANFSSLALGLKLLPSHACCHTALCRGTGWLSLLSLPQTCTPTVCVAPLQGPVASKVWRIKYICTGMNVMNEAATPGQHWQWSFCLALLGEMP